MGRGSLDENVAGLGRAATTELLIGVWSVDVGSEVVPDDDEEEADRVE